MDFFLNELSLHSQFENSSGFLTALNAIMACRTAINNAGHILYCDKQIAQYAAYDDISFQVTVLTQPDPTLKSEVLNWLAKSGPFWLDQRTHSADEYFECQEKVVTDRALGEVAFRIATHQQSGSLSFAPSHFMLNPLLVIWKCPPLEDQSIDVPNFWELAQINALLASLQTPPTTWAAFAAQCRASFLNLVFLESFEQALDGEPFVHAIASRAWELLAMLNRLRGAFDEAGVFTAEGQAILDNYFRRKEAACTDESDTKKIAFRKELTFQKPDGSELFCPFHCKIRHRFYRLHHSWPVRVDEPLYIAYLGPKLTKG
jgi:hypothetical protein